MASTLVSSTSIPTAHLRPLRRHRSSSSSVSDNTANCAMGGAQSGGAHSSKGSVRRPRSSVVMGANAHKLTPSDALKLVDSVETFIFDCDGVIWKGDSLIEGVPETLDLLRALGKRLIFVTNNSTKSRAGYTGKFKSLGLNVTAEEIFSSSFAAAAYLESINFKKKAYVVGETGILEELDNVGVRYIGGEADAGKQVSLKSGEFMHHDPEVGAVIVGFDRNINYYKIQYATLCIYENPGCMFIATNTDAVTHLTDAQEWAGNGSMVGAIKGSTKREPIVVGKPAAFMLDYIANKYKLRKDQICMVGDRLDTDILFGADGGLQTMLVLSGVTTEETLKSPDNNICPDFYTDKLADLLCLKK
jgi:phosphoglycolate phosphatase